MPGLNPLPDQLKSIWTSNGLPEEFLSNLTLVGNPDASVPSSFRVGLAAQISIGLSGLSAAYLHYLRTGIKQNVTIDARHAALSCHSEAWYSVDDSIYGGNIWDNIAGLYKTKDGGWVRIHTNFPHHRAGVLEILGIPDTPENRATKAEVIPAILNWDAEALEEACAKRGMCVFRLRTPDEWERTAQAQALADVPVVDVRNVGDAPKRSFEDKKKASRPLSGIKVLDLSRVLAGPVGGRALAAHGAQVLLITSPNLPSLPLLDTETSLGKRTTQLDLTDVSGPTSDREKFRNLVRGVDIFLQAYRPGGIEAKGFGVEDVIRIKKKNESDKGSQGVVYANLRAWGWEGPWADRRGFDSLVQTAAGFNVDEGNAYYQYLKSQGKETEWTPRPLPMQALDHAAGYLLTFGINVALARALTDTPMKYASPLAAVGKWIRSLGRIDPETAFGPSAQPFPKRTWPLDDEIARLSAPWHERRGTAGISHGGIGSGGGDGKEKGKRKMTALRHAAVLSVTPVREGLLDGEVDDDWGAPMRLNADEPVWI